MDQACLTLCPSEVPLDFLSYQHFRAHVTYIFTAMIAICISFLTLPCWGCKNFNIDCFNPVSATISLWNPVAEAEEQHPTHLLGHHSTHQTPTYLAGAPASRSSSLCGAAAPSPSQGTKHRAGDCWWEPQHLPYLPSLGKRGVKRRKYRGKGNKEWERKTEQISFFLRLAAELQFSLDAAILS